MRRPTRQEEDWADVAGSAGSNDEPRQRGDTPVHNDDREDDYDGE